MKKINLTGNFIGQYSDQVKLDINQYGGKLGFLKTLADNPEIIQKMENIGINISTELNPIIINSIEGIKEEEFLELQKKFNKYKKISTGDTLIRVSHPGDFRSFVDIFPTEKVNEKNSSIEDINQAIINIRKKIVEIEPDIIRYAIGTGVEYSGVDSISMGIVNEIDFKSLVTVTEHPNIFNEILIDDAFKTWDTSLREIDSTILKIDGNENIIGRKEINTSLKGKIIKNFFNLMREEGFFDKEIAYQLEIGETNGGNLILLQVKEFTRKNEVKKEVEKYIPSMVTHILFGDKLEDKEINIVFGRNAKEGFKKVEQYTQDNICLVLQENRFNPEPNEYSDKISSFLHADVHGGALNHNSFRMTQAVLQKGGIVLLGTTNQHTMEDEYGNNKKLIIKNNSEDIEVEVE